MTDTKNTPDTAQKNTLFSFFKSPLFMIILIAAGVMFISKDLSRFGYILIVLLGFGCVIMVHELGHFIAAKSVGILVEAFSIGMGPILVGIKRLPHGFRFRILPRMGADEESPEGKGIANFIVPTRKSIQGETEYQIRILPIGGFVKMLGQEDMGVAEHDNNPRSFVNKGFWPKFLVISAGVLMNVISGALLFIGVFAHGVDLPPAIIGDVMEGSPAQKAGLAPGDKIIAINGDQKDLFTFTELRMAAAFADQGEAVDLTAISPDGTRKELSIVPEMNEAMGIQMLGLAQPESLTIARPKEAEALKELEKLGFQTGDQIVAVDNQPIERADEFYKAIIPEVGIVDLDTITITIKRKIDGNFTLINIPIDLTLDIQSMTADVLGVMPRLKVHEVISGSPAEEAGILAGDIILQAGTVFCPEMQEFSDIVKNHGGKVLPIKVLRVDADGTERQIDLAMTPRWKTPSLSQRIQGVEARPIIGIRYSANDVDHLTVGANAPKNNDEKTGESEAEGKTEVIDLPRGAQIIEVDGQPVKNFKEFISQLYQHKGQKVSLGWIPYGESSVKRYSVTVPDNNSWIGLGLRPDLGQLGTLPLKRLEMTFKGNSVKEYLTLGARTSWTFIAQTYVMIKGMINGTIGMKAASGPVGILKMSYTIASERPLVYYLYFMATISMAIAVFNFLPLPIVDGGLAIILIIEAIKGSPLPMKTQEIINYAGLALLGGFALFVTFQDVLKIITGQM